VARLDRFGPHHWRQLFAGQKKKPAWPGLLFLCWHARDLSGPRRTAEQITAKSIIRKTRPQLEPSEQRRRYISMLIVAFTWIILSVAVGLMAERRGRSGLAWIWVAECVSPLIAAVVLALLPNRLAAFYTANVEPETGPPKVALIRVASDAA
jgi:hypothetical protein